MMRGVFPYLLLFLLPCLVSGQSFPSAHYGSAEGLANSTVYSILQDDRGQMWFGTGLGLSSFDGDKFTNYEPPPELSADFVISMAQAKSGDLWLGTWGGGLCILKDGKISRYTPRSGVIPGKIKQIAVDAKGRVWVMNNYEVGVLSQDVYTSIKLPFFVANVGGSVFGIMLLPDGTLLAASHIGIYYYSEEKKAFLPYKPGIIPVRPYFGMSRDSLGNLIFGSEGNITILAPDSSVRTISRGIKDKDRIWVVQADSRGRIWGIGFRSGLVQVRQDSAEAYSSMLRLGREQLNAIHEDREGNIWLGSYGSGIYRISDLNAVQYSVTDGLTNGFVISLCEGMDGEMLAGTRNGLSSVLHGRARPVNVPLSRHPLSYTAMLFRDRDGSVWIGGNSAVFIRKDGNIRRLSGSHVPSVMYRDSRGRLWMGSDHGLLTFADKGLDIDRRFPEMAGESFFDIREDREGNIWFACETGALVLKGDKLTRIDEKNSPLRGAVLSIRENKQGLWFASDNGISCYSAGKWHHYPREEYLNSPRINGLDTDHSGRLWIATNRGVVRFDGKHFRHFTVQDGLISNEVQVLYVDGKNLLWVGTSNGLSTLNIDSGEKPFSLAPIYITRMTSGDSVYHKPDDLHLGPEQNSFKIDYIAYSYRNNPGISYQYRLNEGRWSNTMSRSIEFSSLPPGEYFFEVRAVQDGDIISATPARLRLSIAAPYWRSAWFLSSASLGVLVLLFASVRLYIARVQAAEKKKNAIRFRMLELEQQALNALMNPHFIFNSLNSIQRYLNCFEPALASDYLAKFARLIRLTFSNTQHGTITLAEEMERIELYLLLEKMRFEDELDFECSIEPGLEIQRIVIPSMILQPFVENAIWHGIMPKEDGGEILLSASRYREKFVKITIADDGIGIDKSRSVKKKSSEHLSSSMMLTEERLRILSTMSGEAYTLDVRDRAGEGDGTGTIVEIVFPLVYSLSQVPVPE